MKDNYSKSMDATYYTIAPTHDMPLEQFKLLLSKLAASVVKESA